MVAAVRLGLTFFTPNRLSPTPAGRTAAAGMLWRTQTLKAATATADPVEESPGSLKKR